MELSPSIRLAMLNIMKEGTTDVDVFTRPFELEYLKNQEYFDSIKLLVEQKFKKAFEIIKNGNGSFEALRMMHVQPLRNILVPKKTLFDFRKCGYIDPLDEIVYLTLAIMISNKVEKQRIHKKSKIVFSYRLKPNIEKEMEPTYLFDPTMNYTSFRNNVSQTAKNNKIKVVVSCDIGNFYDRLNLHRLENTLLSVDGIDKSAVELLNELLLYWSNRDSYGIPVGSNASRILAEASLINIDRYLMEKKIIFNRFVDDFRLFAEDARQAHSWLSILVDRLNQEGLFLNTSKTSIIEASKVIRANFNQPSVDVNDEEKKDLPLIIRGYSGLIPTKFRELSDREINNLKTINIDEMKEKKIDIDLIDPNDLKKYLRVLVSCEKWDELAQTCSVLIRFPQFFPYYLDAIKKHSQQVLPYKEVIISTIIILVEDSNLLEYLRIYVIRFLCTTDFCSKKIVLDCYFSLKRSEGVYLGRAILEDINELVDRDDLLEIKKDFLRADSAEKRQILKLLRNCFHETEFRAFYKNISLNEDDPWYKFIADSTKLTNKKNKSTIIHSKGKP
ncbi:reverse transcriptase [Spirochaetia bacterium]|nr:reverse transcriptase [Spirochaetia bacterium]